MPFSFTSIATHTHTGRRAPGIQAGFRTLASAITATLIFYDINFVCEKKTTNAIMYATIYEIKVMM